MKNTVLTLLCGAQSAPAIGAPEAAPLTHGGLRDLAHSTVAALNAIGIGRGDRVAIVLPNGPEMAASFIAIAAGATTCPLNPAYRAEEFEFYLNDLNAKALVVLAEGWAPWRSLAARLLWHHWRFVTARPAIEDG